jgi:hypothetical protein
MLAVEGVRGLLTLTGESVTGGPDREFTPRLRAAVVAWSLLKGDRLTTRDVADMCNFSVRSAQSLLCLLSDKLPIYCDDAGVWQRISIN